MKHSIILVKFHLVQIIQLKALNSKQGQMQYLRFLNTAYNYDRINLFYYKHFQTLNFDSRLSNLNIIILEVKMQADSTQQKQKYLRENILQSGYDPSDFVTFLQQNQNINHIDIQGWSMKKIQHLVNAYKQYKYYASKQSKQVKQTQGSEKKKIFADREAKLSKNKQQNSVQSKSKSQKQIFKINLLQQQGGKMVYEKQKMSFYQQQKSKIQYPRYSPLFDYEFKAKCKCTQTENLLSEKLQILIPKFQIVQSAGLFLGFGSKTQVWYIVKTNIKKETTIKRLLQDFDWLSATLMRLYPYLSLPELGQFRKELDNPNQKRRIQIQEYLHHLCNRSQLLKSNLLSDFLTVHSDKMQKLKKSYDSMGFAKGVALLQSCTGQVQIQYTKKSRQYQQCCHNYSKKVLTIHQKFTQSIAKTIESMDVVANNMNFLVDYFAQLHQTYNQLMNKFPEYKSHEYNEILINMNNLFHGISDNIKSHSQNLSTHLKDYFRLNSLNDKNIIRLQKYVKQEQKLYLDYKYNLSRKKQRFLTQPDKWDIDLKSLSGDQVVQLKINKQKAYELMLPRQTQQQNQIKTWVAFLYTNFIKQFDTYVKQSTWRYAQKYKAFSTDLLNKDKNYLQALTRFLSESRKLTK